MHVGDLDGLTRSGSSGWRARVTITIHDQSHAAVADAVVSATWSGGYSAGASCMTGTDGQCTLSSDLVSLQSNVTFTVDSVAHGSFAYHPGENHDPDGDSDGTTIILSASGVVSLAEMMVAAPGGGFMSRMVNLLVRLFEFH